MRGGRGAYYPTKVIVTFFFSIFTALNAALADWLNRDYAPQIRMDRQSERRESRRS